MHPSARRRVHRAGGVAERPDGRGVPIVNPGGGGALIWINPVAEAKTVKNRMHLDMWAGWWPFVAGDGGWGTMGAWQSGDTSTRRRGRCRGCCSGGGAWVR